MVNFCAYTHTLWRWRRRQWCGRAESAEEENEEQDDSMEKPNDVNDGNTYVSHYPDIRRYSMANVMETTNRQQQYSANTTQEADDNNEGGGGEGQRETKIDIPSSQPPQYSQAIADKLIADKKVKVSLFFKIEKKIFFNKVWKKLKEACRESKAQTNYHFVDF